MTAPHSHLLEGSPRLHYLEWNPHAPRHCNPAARQLCQCVVVGTGGARDCGRVPAARARPARAWRQRMGAAGGVRADRLRKRHREVRRARDGERGKSRWSSVTAWVGMNVLAFARQHPDSARGAIAIDVPVTSTRGRDRYLRRLKSIPVVTYPDLATAKARFRLMPNEGGIADDILHEIAEKSLARTDEGRWTLKFDRECFLGGDRMAVLETIKEIRIPTMLVRAEHSRIMTAEGAEHARASNPQTRLVTIADAHHHVILERPEAVARVIEQFSASL